MKRIMTISLAMIFGFSVIAQESPEVILKAIESRDSTLKEQAMHHFTQDVEEKGIDGKDTIINSESADTTKIRFGKRNIVIIEKDGTTAIEIPDRESIEESRKDEVEKKKSKKFKGHWSGFEWGFNGYVDPNFSTNMKDDMRYLAINQGRSWNFNLNFTQYSLGFGTNKIGLVTGLGFEFNNYHFRTRNQTNITVDRITGITGVDNTYASDPDKNVTKSKFSTTYLTVPLLFEFQIPVGDSRHRIFFSTGVIGGVRIGSHTKVEYEGSSKGEDRIRDDFNLSPFRYGLTARMGYRGLKFFANYYPTSLFEKDMGPELYPFSVGLILLNFN